MEAAAWVSACEAWREAEASGERAAGTLRPDAAPCPACGGGDGRWSSTLAFARANPEMGPDGGPEAAMMTTAVMTAAAGAGCEPCGGSGIVYLAATPDGDPAGAVPGAAAGAGVCAR